MLMVLNHPSCLLSTERERAMIRDRGAAPKYMRMAWKTIQVIAMTLLFKSIAEQA